MNNSLEIKINKMREVLNSDPGGFVAGKIPYPATSASSTSDKLNSFLKICDGGRFGSIDLWSVKELPRNQFHALDFPGGSQNWLVFGQVLYEPIAISLDNDFVVLHESNSELKLLDEIDSFLENYVFGEGYANFIPGVKTCPWWGKLVQEKLVSKPK